MVFRERAVPCLAGALLSGCIHPPPPHPPPPCARLRAALWPEVGGAGSAGGAALTSPRRWRLLCSERKTCAR